MGGDTFLMVRFVGQWGGILNVVVFPPGVPNAVFLLFVEGIGAV